MIRLRCTLIVLLNRLAERAARWSPRRLTVETVVRVGDAKITYRWCECERVHYADAICYPRGGTSAIFFERQPSQGGVGPMRSVPYLSFRKAREDGALAAAVRAADLRDAQEQKRAAAHTSRLSFGLRD